MNSIRMGILCAFALLLLSASQIELRIILRGKDLKSIELKPKRRVYIIKCCGRKSCSNVQQLKKNASIQTVTAKVAQTEENNARNKKTITAKLVPVIELNSGEMSTAERNEITSGSEVTETTKRDSYDLKGSSTVKSTAPTTKTTPNADSAVTETMRNVLSRLPFDLNESASVKSISTTTITHFISEATTILPLTTDSSSKIPASTSSKSLETIFSATNSMLNIETSTAVVIFTSTPPSSVSTSSVTSNSVSNFPTSSSSPILTSTSSAILSSTTTSTTTRSPILFDFSTLESGKNSSLFDRNNNLIDPHSYGNWREICGEMFLFGRTIVTWEANVRSCFSIEMKPLAFETSEKFACFKAFTKQEVWQHNFNYWTSGRRLFDNNTFRWGYYTNSEPFPDSPSSQGPDCVHIALVKNNKTELTRKNCSNTYVLSCKGKTTPAPPCFLPSCPNVSCAKNNSLYSSAPDWSFKYLTDPKKFGTWKKINFRTFMFSLPAKSWSQAVSFCCSIGMKLLSLDVDYKYDGLSKIIGDQLNLSGKYWTSGTDNGCSGTFAWCAVNKKVRNAIWGRGEPHLGGSKCLAIDASGANAALSTEFCDKNFQFICEARATLNASTHGRALKDECAANLNVSIFEQDNIFNNTKFDVKIKCFLKCLSENGGLFLNGRFVDEQLIKIVELISTDHTQMMDDFKVVDECSHLQGMDECDTAAMVCQCGQEKAPTLLANVVKVVELNSSGEESPLQPTVGQCYNDYPCVLNESLRTIFRTNGPTTDGGLITDICGKRYLIGNKITFVRGAASWCCQYGLNLVSLETVEELKCIVASPLGR
ncbi:Hypothetical predicted protein [Cloeon dipterum]|uniref:C-type lectin domain-containing protein n=1 Tax=Cloeon dipterum TaxID=197152 RepID=A0A8S1E5M5_9INSE|nr:Hypothetical predicted protein [Cloeon dipterum]